MTGLDIAVRLLLIVGTGAVVLSVTGVLLARNFYDRLHYLGPASTIGAVSIGAAVLVKESLNQAGIKAVLIAALLFLMNAVLTHATARAGRVQRHGELRLTREEKENRAD